MSKTYLCRVPEYIFQEQFGKGLLSAPDGWREIDDWFASAKNASNDRGGT